MSYGLSPWLLAFDLARLAVFVLLATKGGRWDRALARMLIPVWLTEQVVFRLPDAVEPLGAALLAAAYLAGHLWLLQRYRPGWLVAATALQAARCGLWLLLLVPIGVSPGPVGAATMALGFARLVCVLYGVARRRLGPPVPIPAPAG